MKYLVRYEIMNDYNETEHQSVTDKIENDYGNNAKKIMPATWIIKSSGTLDGLNTYIKSVLDSFVSKKNYYFFLCKFDGEWHSWLPKYINDWI